MSTKISTETRRALSVEREAAAADQKWFDETTDKLDKASENLETTVEILIGG